MGNKSLTQASPCPLQDKLTLVISAEQPVVSVLDCREYNWWKADPAELLQKHKEGPRPWPSPATLECPVLSLACAINQINRDLRKHSLGQTSRFACKSDVSSEKATSWVLKAKVLRYK